MKPYFTWLMVILLALAIVLAPGLLSPYGLVLAFGFCVAAGLALAWNLVGGLAGQFALGHALFVGMGAYTVALGTNHTALPLPLLIAGAMLLCGAVAALSAIAFLRMRAAYFSVATMGLALAAMAWAVTSPALGAAGGITLPGDLALDDLWLFRVSGALALATLALTAWIVRTPYGLSLMAVRDDEQAAAECGLDPLRLKASAMALSGALTGGFGALIALQKQMVEPLSAFSMTWTISMIMISVIGGLGSVWGPVVGAIILYGAQQLLDELAVWNLLISALLLIAVIRLAPGGIVELAARGWRRWPSRRGACARPTAASAADDAMSS